MNITLFTKINYKIIKEPDETNRNIGYSYFEDCIFVGKNLFYPNILLYNKKQNILVSPYNEMTMSFKKTSYYDDNKYQVELKQIINTIIWEPVFFFIYNFDNYYHFIYDTIPYLYVFFQLKKNIPNLKILVNYPNAIKKSFYKFNTEFLEKLINTNDLIYHNETNLYRIIYVSNSLTHGGYSNLKPRPEINNLYEELKVVKNYNTPKKIYISRRTWINKDNSNLGTNYTTRRKMINEDELVNKLKEKSFVEIFTENLSTDEKINLFLNADIIVGSIGGGMSNLMFSSKNTKAIVIVTPYFLDINYRFKYSLEYANVIYYYNAYTYKEKNLIPLYSRVKINGIIGEICGYENNKYIINLSNNDVVGFNNEISYNKIVLNDNEFELIDKGLNSPYYVDIDNLMKII